MTMSLGTEILKTKMFTADELAQLLDLNVQTCYRALRMGVIRGRKIGREGKISERNLQNFLNCLED